MYAECARRSCVCKVKVEVENVFSAEIATCCVAVQFLKNYISQEIAGFELACNLSEQRQHIFLLAESYAVVHLTVEVDSKIAYLQEWALDVQQQSLRLHNVLASDNHATGKSKRTVEPCRHNRTTIHLGVQLHDAALGKHFCVGLDAESRRVAKSANHVEASVGDRLVADAESKYRRVVLGNKEAVATLHLA